LGKTALFPMVFGLPGSAVNFGGWCSCSINFDVHQKMLPHFWRLVGRQKIWGFQSYVGREIPRMQEDIFFENHRMDRSQNKLNVNPKMRQDSNPIGSMGLVYLPGPTFTIKINHSCRYTNPMDPMGMFLCKLKEYIHPHRILNPQRSPEKNTPFPKNGVGFKPLKIGGFSWGFLGFFRFF